ncbi:MAG: hypothetical protein Kow00114_20420 [Kiloniellaceae bacterium]
MPSFPSRLGSHARYLGLMMQRCGIDPARFTHDSPEFPFIAVARACMACQDTARCRRWLDATANAAVQQPPAFCPNAERFRRAREAG